MPQNDLGFRTDVLDGCPKVIGIELLLRAMSPEVIAVDEIGGEKEMELIEWSMYCGCTILATAHGEECKGRFERYVFLKPGENPGTLERVCDGAGREVKLVC